MIDIMNRFPEEEAALREMERVFHSHVDKKEQPDRGILYQCGEHDEDTQKTVSGTFPRHFQLIAAVDRNWGIGNKGRC